MDRIKEIGAIFLLCIVGLMVFANSIPHIQHNHDNNTFVSEKHEPHASESHLHHSAEDENDHSYFMMFLAEVHGHQTHVHDFSLEQTFEIRKNLISKIILFAHFCYFELGEKNTPEYVSFKQPLLVSNFDPDSDFLRGPPVA